MYLPSHFAADDLAEVARFVGEVGAADLVTFDGTKPVASLIPVLWDRGDGPGNHGAGPGNHGAGPGDGGHGRLLGHLALANPQWRAAGPGTVALAIVHGPHAYISPSWYPSTARHGRAVPTWNYVTVHFTGPLTIHRDANWLRDIVTRLTSKHEAGREHPWAVDDAPPRYIEGQLRAIVGVELTITSVEAKHKLSQNRDAGDRAGAAAGLRGEAASGAAAIAGLMAADLAREDGAR